MPERTFDRRPSPPDERDYPAMQLVASTTGTVESRLWRCVPRLDQGAIGACVGYGIAHALGAFPHPREVDDGVALGIYAVAQQLDEFDDTPPEEGTSVRAGLKAARQLGFISSYWRCADASEAMITGTHKGPIVLGVMWPESLEDPSHEIVSTVVEGAVLGGHCVAWHGYHWRTDLHRIRNSWGSSWAHNGDFFVTTGGLVRLIANDGEAWAITKAAA